MRTVLVAVLTFLAGLTIGAVFLSHTIPAGEGADVSLRDTDVPSTVPRTGSRPDTAPSLRGDPPNSRGPSVRSPYEAPAPASPRVAAPVAWVLDLVNRDYALRRRQPDARVPREFDRDAANAAVDYASRQLEGFGGWMAEYLDTREAVGLLGTPPQITVQARGTGSIGSFARTRSHEAAKLSATALELAAPPHPDDEFEAYVESGVQPLDQALLLERIDVTYHVGFASSDPVKRPWENGGDLRIVVDGYSVFDVRGVREGRRSGRLIGRKVLRPPAKLPRVVVTVRRGVAEVVVSGRYVPLAKVGELRDESFHWVQEGDDGLLGDELVLLQVLADHGGGNDRKVRLDGTTYRVDRPSRGNLWDPSLSLSGLQGSLSWSENAGRVPEGMFYRITRIDWRTRLDPANGKHSDFEIRYGGRKLVERFAPDGAEASGTWTGELDVKRGDEHDLEVVCSYFGMGEAVVYGTLVDASDD